MIFWGREVWRVGRLIVFTQPSKSKFVNCDLVRSAIFHNRNSIADLLAIGDSPIHGTRCRNAVTAPNRTRLLSTWLWCLKHSLVLVLDHQIEARVHRTIERVIHLKRFAHDDHENPIFWRDSGANIRVSTISSRKNRLNRCLEEMKRFAGKLRSQMLMILSLVSLQVQKTTAQRFQLEGKYRLRLSVRRD